MPIFLTIFDGNVQKGITISLIALALQFFCVEKLCAQRENIFLHPDKFYKKYFPTLKIIKKPVDTTYIKIYPNYLSSSVKLLLPKLYYDISPAERSANHKGAASLFRANIYSIVGFSAGYRFVTAGFAIALKPADGAGRNYANSIYRTATITYNSSKYNLQFKFIKIKGLTDINGLNALDIESPYAIRKDLTIKEFQVVGIYNVGWKKYSYSTAMDFKERQLKSRMGFLVKAGVYNNQLYGDTAILSARQRPYFEGLDNLSRMNSYSVKLAPGVGGNLVFARKFYLALSVFIPYTLYFIRFYTPNDALIRKEASLQAVLDGMATLGYQSKRLYMGIRFQADSKRATLNSINTLIVNQYLIMDVGYRFTTPKIVKRIYKKTMPPGM